jgi:hypothetical protein
MARRRAAAANSHKAGAGKTGNAVIARPIRRRKSAARLVTSSERADHEANPPSPQVAPPADRSGRNDRHETAVINMQDAFSHLIC